MPTNNFPRALLGTCCLLLAASRAHAGTLYEDKRAGVAFTAPDGWIEVPTPPVPEGADGEDAGPVVPVVRYEAAEAASDGTLGRFEVFLVRASSAEAASREFERHAERTWRDFEISERRDLGGGRAFSATVSGGKSFGAVLASGDRFAAILLTGGPDTTDAPLIAATGTFLWLDPDPAAALRVPPGWKARETQHYRIRYSGDDDFAANVGRHLEAISAELRRVLPLEPPGADRRALDVRLFRNEREFEAYAAMNGVHGAQAYFSPAQRELVAFMDDRSPDRTFHVLYHEATHQYLRDALGPGVRIPIWLDEGLAEVFFPGSFGAGGRFTLPPNAARRAEARDAVASGKAPSLSKLFSMDRDTLYALEPGYALGWSVAHFLLNDPRYRGSVIAYLETLRETKEDAKARAKLWANFSMEQLESDWKRWVAEE
jgi:hypothetical protein